MCNLLLFTNLLLQTKTMKTVACMRFAETSVLKSNFLLRSFRKNISSWNKALHHITRPKYFYWNENSALIQLDWSLQYPRKYSPKQQQRARAAFTKTPVIFMADRGTALVQPASSLCRRGRLQVEAGIYSMPRCQVVPPYSVMLQVCHQHPKPKMYLPSSKFLANDWHRHVCQEGAFCVAGGERGVCQAPLLPYGCVPALGCPLHGCGTLQAHIYPATG